MKDEGCLYVTVFVQICLRKKMMTW